MKIRVVSVVGARPQFVKLGATHGPLSLIGEHVIVHTGQHYESLMSGAFFEDLSIPAPFVNLGLGSGSHGKQTGRMLVALEEVFSELRPDWVLVYGDTNSTLAASIAAAKLPLKLAHLEAGLRSWNRQMPEEHNRVLSDHASDLCLAPTELAMQNLASEGLSSRSTLVGDVMVDVLLHTINNLGLSIPQPESARADYYLATVHRQENVDQSEVLLEILECLNNLDRFVRLLVHPRLRNQMSKLGLSADSYKRIRFTDSLSYPDLLSELSRSPGLITDSGGLQKEAYLLRVPCVTLRKETEWPETIELGWNQLSDSIPEDIEHFFGEFAQPHPALLPMVTGTLVPEWRKRYFKSSNRSVARLLPSFQMTLLSTRLPLLRARRRP